MSTQRLSHSVRGGIIHDCSEAEATGMSISRLIHQRDTSCPSMEYYLAIKGNEVLIHARKGVHFETLC